MKPIAILLKERQLSELKSKQHENKKVSLLSIEEQIRALEQNISESEEDKDEEENDNDSEINEDFLDEGIKIEKNEKGQIVKILSSLEKEKIVPLPKRYLPTKQCLFSDKGKTDFKNQKRKLAFHDEEGDYKKSITKSGFEKTVQDLLQNYEPASIEKRPFYCRVCRFQGKSLDDLEYHRNSSEHRLAIDNEKKMCYCRLCKKQFTSPDQMKDHLKGKAHNDRLNKIKEYQQTRSKFC